MTYQKLFTLICANILIANMSANTYYASPAGKGDGTSYLTPCTLSSGISMLAAGDSLFLLGGQYYMNSELAIKTTGTLTKRTFIGAYTNEKPVFDFRNQPHNKNGVS